MAYIGCTGWSYSDVLSYFLKSEDKKKDELISSKYHSAGGPVAVSDTRITPLSDLYLKTGKELGYTLTDYNALFKSDFVEC